MLAGTVPQTWAQPGAFPNLSVLVIMDVPLTGTLPPHWGSNGSFPVLGVLELGSDSPGAPFSGTLPPEWGSATHWQSLRVLHLTDCSVTGDPASSRNLAQSCIKVVPQCGTLISALAWPNSMLVFTELFWHSTLCAVVTTQPQGQWSLAAMYLIRFLATLP